MTGVYKRVLMKKAAKGMTWNELSAAAGIPLSTWMTGIPTSYPSDDELHKIAPVLDTTYAYLKYGIE